MKRESAWTGGQYSVVRAVLGGYLFVHFVGLLPWAAELFSNRGMLPDARTSPLAHLFPNVLVYADSPAAVTGLIALAAVASLLLAAGAAARPSAIVLWYASACLLGRNPLISNPGIPFVGWILLAIACLPAAPWGSWAARGRVDPDGGWRFPRPIFVAAWVVMATAYTYSGVTKLVSPSWLNGTALARVLVNPLARPGFVKELLLELPRGLLTAATWGVLALELSFAPLALFRRTRPWVWSAMVLVHLGLMVVVDFVDLTAGMLMIHLFTFDPEWVPPRRAAEPDWVFYDGGCGLCHGAVRFALAEDRSGDAFRYAPLRGETFREVLPGDPQLPDSMVVATHDGRVLTKSDAVLHMMQTLGGLWRAFAIASTIVPRSLRNAVYDAVAAVRHRLLPPPPAACPIVPPSLRTRLAP